ncbi:MAG: lysylphosphatidylglycerol synthase transmembrane domain-containing protein [Acidimicrobiaceae bacterium]|nr:lysylphosphatidylglycerol synthase transmembrane domain-containing protein [Acidimicrobiaceae bacterium]MDE0516250.1 lysylphosphatidylglycerol synthase transmembrane domain-containing protein [Acidimicrobiaceae bacterium]
MSGQTPANHDGARPEPQDPPPTDLAAEEMSPAAANRLESLRALRPGQVVLTVGVAVIVTTVLVVSIGRFAGFTKLGDTLTGATWGWLGLCAVGQIGVFVGYAGAFRMSVAGSGDLLAEPGSNPPPVGFWYSLKVALAGFGLTQLVAAGGAAGMAFTFWVFRRLGFSKPNAMLQLITLNTAVYFVFGVVGWLGALAGLLDPAVPIAMAASWLAGFAAVIALARWFIQPRRRARFTQAEDGSRLRRALAVGVSAAAGVREYMHTADGQRLLAWALLYWVGDLVSLWAALQAFGVTVSIPAIVVAYVLGYLAQSVPIPLIATGGVDAATTFTLRAVGVPIEVALLGVVAHRVFAFWLPVIPGLWSATVLVREELPTSSRRDRRLRSGRSE